MLAANATSTRSAGVATASTTAGHYPRYCFQAPAPPAPAAPAPGLLRLHSGESSSPIHSFDHSVPLARKRRFQTPTTTTPSSTLTLPQHATSTTSTSTSNMASATATATMAAAGFDKRHSSASSLQTPGSGTFPSEMLSPMAGSPGFLKREDALKTPITPPSAYLDFLKNYTPAIQSPASATTTSRFPFSAEKSFSSDKSLELSGPKSAILPPTSHPPLSRNASNDSNSSNSSDRSTTTSHFSGSAQSKPSSPTRISIPPSPFSRPAPRSARTPRRLHIPQSPFSPAHGSAQVAPSPFSSTPVSAAPWSATFSPREHNTAEITSQSNKVHVRHVVTRTVTYCRTPLEPAPKGKRRKISADNDTFSISSSKASSEEPPIKQERIERIEEEPANGSEKANA